MSSEHHPKMRPKISQACETCRALKIRCIPSSQGNNQCQKCVKAGTPCILAEHRPPRPRPKRDSKSRVTELESKLEQLIARVDEKTTQRDAREKFPENVNSMTGPSNVSLEQPTQLPHPRASSSSSYRTVECSRSSAIYGTPQSCDSSTPVGFFGRGLLSIEKAHWLLDIFRGMYYYFPFVIIPTNATVHSLYDDKPFLLLSILAAASSREKGLQHILEEELRSTLSTKVVVEGEKSLDLLQGLLVYLAWYQFHYIPCRQQAYQLIQMAIGMVVDLGIDLRPYEAAALKFGRHPSLLQDSRGDDFYSSDARRAYVGSYYLSVSIAKCFGKPNNFEFKDYILECCRSLEDEMQCPTDSLLLPLVKLQRLADDSHKVMLLGRDESVSSMSLLRIQTHVKSFKNQLQEVESSLPSEFCNNTLLALSRHSARMCVHEMEILNPFVPKNRIVALQLPAETLSCARLDILSVCLEAAKDFFETILEIPAVDYRRFSFVEWSRLILATVILYKLSLGVPHMPEWDSESARDTVKLELYLEALCHRMQSIGNPGSGNLPEGTDLFSVMKMIFENVKTTYERLKREPQAMSANDGSKVHETSFPTAQEEKGKKRSLYQPRCPAFPYLGKCLHEHSDSVMGMDTGFGSAINEDSAGYGNGSVGSGNGGSGATGNGSIDDGLSDDRFVGADFLLDQDFWGEMMTEAIYGCPQGTWQQQG